MYLIKQLFAEESEVLLLHFSVLRYDMTLIPFYDLGPGSSSLYLEQTYLLIVCNLSVMFDTKSRMTNPWL